MPFARKIAIAINLIEPQSEILKSLRTLDFLKASEVHFVNVYLTTTYAIGLGESSIVYPVETDRNKIQESSVEALKKLAPTLMPDHFEGKMVVDCLFSDSPKRKFCSYVEEKKIDTVILAAREERGLFESSFTQYVTKHTHANIIILKHKEFS